MSQKVWQDLDQAALDRAYDQTQWAPNWAQVLDRYAARSEQTRQRLGPPLRLSYGPAAIEQLDLHGAGPGLAPALVYVHGGAWRSGRASDYAFVAEPFVRAGARVFIPDFDAVQDRGGDLQVLADQVQRAIQAVWTHAADWGVDAAQIHLCGHSSGAHLAAVAAVAAQAIPWASLMCCSGMYELEPVRRSARSRYVRFDEASVQSLSPARRAAALKAPITVAVGSLESPQFVWQSRLWLDSVVAAGLGASALWAEGLNHFEILETLGDAGGLLARQQLQRMGLNVPPGAARPA